MKTTRLSSVLIAATLLAPVTAMAQVNAQKVLPAVQMQLDPHYQAREPLAPAHIKSQLTELRKNIADSRLKYQVGFTSAMERSLAQLAGEKTPADQASKAQTWGPIQKQLLELDKQAELDYIKKNPAFRIPVLPVPSATAASFDWRRYNKVTPIRDQGNCGSCWAFAVAGTYESSYLIRNNRATDTSEQALLSCSGAGNCGGGDRSAAYTYMVGHGYGAEAAFPYTHTDAPCHTYPVTAKPVAWGFVNPTVEIPTVAALKQAIVEHGPISVSVNATAAFQGYAGGIFYQAAPSINTNHAVVLIGWDDSKGAWLLRNSWGTGWGETCGYGAERGYMWIAYNSSNVGRWARWVRAEHALFINPNILQLLQKHQVFKP
jgi:cathepsin L